MNLNTFVFASFTSPNKSLAVYRFHPDCITSNLNTCRIAVLLIFPDYKNVLLFVRTYA